MTANSHKCLIRITLVTLVSLIACFYASAQSECNAGALFYYEKQDGIYLLLADHLIDNERGWSSFGGECAGKKPQVTASEQLIKSLKLVMT